MPTVLTGTKNPYGWGDGVARDVRVTSIEVAFTNEQQTFGELRVYFDRTTWDVEKHGLIYTDEDFLHNFQDLLVAQYNYSIPAAKSIDYSEQGMQGRDYVSFDIGAGFIVESTPWMDDGILTLAEPRALTLEEKIRILVMQSKDSEEDCGMDAGKVYQVLGTLQDSLLELITH